MPTMLGKRARGEAFEVVDDATSSTRRSTVNREWPDIPIRVCLGSFYLPKRRNEQGYDAHFINRSLNAFGLGDGVNSSSDFAEQLLWLCEGALLASRTSSGGMGIRLERVLERAMSMMTVQGASTLCLATVEGSVLHAISIGDTGFLVVRRGSIIYRSPSHCCGFVHPCTISLELRQGDIIVAGTNGFFDYISDADILKVLRMNRHIVTPQVMASALAYTAMWDYILFTAADGRATISLSRANIPDDVTVVVAIIK